MCMGGGVPTPKTYAAPKSPANAADLAKSDEEARRRAASGYQGTILTGTNGGVQSNVAGKTLLGA